MEKKLKNLFMQDWFFIVIMAIMGAGVYTTSNMYLTYGVGTFNMVDAQIYLSERDWMTMGSMGIGIYLARIMEGSMVGLIDIGGGVMVGIGMFLVGMTGILGFEVVLDNFYLSLLVGGLLGMAQGTVMMLIRKLIPAGVTASGSDIMMGVGHQISSYMGPLFILCALMVSIPMGICAAIGGAIFFARGKNEVGGIIIGMFIAALIWA